MDRPSFSSSLARAKTASAPSPFSCETRDAIRLMVEEGILSFCGRQRSDRNMQTVDEARKHLEGRGGQEKFDQFLVAKSGFQFGVESVIDALRTSMQAVGKAKPEFFLDREGAIFEIGDSRDLPLARAFFARRGIVRGDRIFGNHQPGDAHGDQLL